MNQVTFFYATADEASKAHEYVFASSKYSYHVGLHQSAQGNYIWIQPSSVREPITQQDLERIEKETGASGYKVN